MMDILTQSDALRLFHLVYVVGWLCATVFLIINPIADLAFQRWVPLTKPLPDLKGRGFILLLLLVLYFIVPSATVGPPDNPNINSIEVAGFIIIAVLTALVMHRIIYRKAFPALGIHLQRNTRIHAPAAPVTITPKRKIFTIGAITICAVIGGYALQLAFLTRDQSAGRGAEALANTYFALLSFVNGEALTKSLLLGLFGILILFGLYVALFIFIIKPLFTRSFSSAGVTFSSKEKCLYVLAGLMGLVASFFVPFFRI